MKELIEAYLIHTKHCLMYQPVQHIVEDNRYTNTYAVHICNNRVDGGTEVIYVSCKELLSFMWSRIK